MGRRGGMMRVCEHGGELKEQRGGRDARRASGTESRERGPACGVCFLGFNRCRGPSVRGGVPRRPPSPRKGEAGERRLGW